MSGIKLDGLVGGTRSAARQARGRPGDRETPACREHLVQHQAERVDVGPCRRPPARRTVPAPCTPACRRGRGDRAARRQTGEAEVGDARAAAPVDHHVGRLQIAVQHAASCAAASPAHSCRASSSRLVRRQPADAPQQRREILAVHVLHREEVLAVGLADVVDAADVRVRHLARDADLVVEARQAVGVCWRRSRAGTSARPAGRA